jgi:hypothetical protein
MPSQFVHLGSYGRKPRKGAPRWSCIGGVTAEGARAPHASRHIPFPVEPTVLHGIAPIEAGRIAEERAHRAFDATGKRRLRCDGIALLAGVVSYPIPRRSVNEDPCDRDVYNLWCLMTLAWLLAQFGDHLMSVVEHRDESYYHLHFYVVPTLDPTNQLNVNRVHPGRYAKIVAAAEGADQKNQDRSYRAGVRRWQDDYHRAVSLFFGHDRYGPKRARVSRREREMQQRMEAEQARQQAALDAERAESERKQARAQAEFDRERARLNSAADQAAWQTYAKPHYELRQRYAQLARARDAERQSAGATIAALRAKVAELQANADMQFVP